MGYTTEFTGAFELDAPLSAAQIAYLNAFNQTRRMKRDAAVTAQLPDPVREAAGLPVGEEGGHFVGSTNNYGQDHTADILDNNNPPSGQPGLWCQWVPSDDGQEIGWDGGEKFYDYTEWLEYIIEHFLNPWGRTLSGEVTWAGEEHTDLGKITVKDNVVTVSKAKITY